MKELIVISGKGGTGKTSITASLVVLNKNSVIADCDVDAADLHLLLAPKNIETHDFVSGHEAAININKCRSCGICEDACRFDAINHDSNGIYRVDPISCEGCKVCVEQCPAQTISFRDSHCGEWFVSETKYGLMTHARLKPGAENSGKLVSIIRNEAKKIAEQRNIENIIVDGPPGIGCPVISSITGADEVLIITEPTVSGLHDMERVYKTAKHFGVKTSLAINKWDIDEEYSRTIEEFAKNENIPVLGRIPYSPLFTEAQVNGKTIVEYLPESAETKAIEQLWGKLF